MWPFSWLSGDSDKVFRRFWVRPEIDFGGNCCLPEKIDYPEKFFYDIEKILKILKAKVLAISMSDFKIHGSLWLLLLSVPQFPCFTLPSSLCLLHLLGSLDFEKP